MEIPQGNHKFTTDKVGWQIFIPQEKNCLPVDGGHCSLGLVGCSLVVDPDSIDCMNAILKCTILHQTPPAPNFLQILGAKALQSQNLLIMGLSVFLTQTVLFLQKPLKHHTINSIVGLGLTWGSLMPGLGIWG